MEGTEKELTVKEVAEQMLRCKLDVYNRIEEINNRLGDGAIRMDEIESILDKHEKQRENYQQEIKDEFRIIHGELASGRNDFNNHDRVEMEKYDKIIDALNNLTAQLKKTAEDTDANTQMLDIQKKQDEINQAVQEALDKDHAPYREYKKQAILAVIGIVSTGIVVGLYKLTVFVSDIDNLLKGGS